MQRGEPVGFGLSVLAHVGLLVLLSLNLMSVRKLPKLSEPMDVMLVDKAGLVSAAPTMSKEAPQAAEAPEVAKTIEEAPPPVPTPPKPAPPEPTPTPPKPVASPPKPTPAKPTPAPAKPSPAPKAKEAPAPPAPVKAPPAKPAPPALAKAKPKATSLGTDFLKGIPVDKSVGKGEAPRVAGISAEAMNGLAALIRQQVLPCYVLPAGGADIERIKATIHLQMRKDGSPVVIPQIVGQTGVTPENQPYARQMGEAAVRAFQRCAPYKLPAEFYDNGWKDITLNFSPSR